MKDTEQVETSSGAVQRAGQLENAMKYAQKKNNVKF